MKILKQILLFRDESWCLCKHDCPSLLMTCSYFWRVHDLLRPPTRTALSSIVVAEEAWCHSLPCPSLPVRSFRKKTALFVTTTCYLVQATSPSTTEFSKSDSMVFFRPFFSKICCRAGFSKRLQCHSLARDSAGNLRLKSSWGLFYTVQNYSHPEQFQIILGNLTNTIIYVFLFMPTEHMCFDVCFFHGHACLFLSILRTTVLHVAISGTFSASELNTKKCFCLTTIVQASGCVEQLRCKLLVRL